MKIHNKSAFVPSTKPCPELVWHYFPSAAPSVPLGSLYASSRTHFLSAPRRAATSHPVIFVRQRSAGKRRRSGCGEPGLMTTPAPSRCYSCGGWRRRGGRATATSFPTLTSRDGSGAVVAAVEVVAVVRTVGASSAATAAASFSSRGSFASRRSISLTGCPRVSSSEPPPSRSLLSPVGDGPLALALTCSFRVLSSADGLFSLVYVRFPLCFSLAFCLICSGLRWRMTHIERCPVILSKIQTVC